MMGPTVREILTALCENLYQGLVRFGLGMAGLPYRETKDKDYEEF